MKTALTGLLLGIVCLAQADTAQADVKAPPGSHFEVQVELARYRPSYGRPPIVSYRWETYSGPFTFLSQAEKDYDLLVSAADAGKLREFLGLEGAVRPTGVRLVYIVASDSPFDPDEVIVVESIEVD